MGLSPPPSLWHRQLHLTCKEIHLRKFDKTSGNCLRQELHIPEKTQDASIWIRYPNTISYSIQRLKNRVWVKAGERIVLGAPRPAIIRIKNVIHQVQPPPADE